MEHPQDPVAVLVERLGADRAAALLAELGAHGLVVLDETYLAQLEGEAAGYRRLASLVEAPDA
jgi:hypothetical protein